MIIIHNIAVFTYLLIIHLFIFHIVPSDSPQNVNAVILSSMSVMVTWEEVPRISQNGIIIQYEVLLESTTEVDVRVNVSQLKLSVNVTELEGSTLYAVSVRAYTSEGPGPYSNTLVQVITDKDSTFVNFYIGDLIFL